MIISAGLALIRSGTILLGHPSKASWKGQYSIPKGNVIGMENLVDAAIRETREEVGIDIDKADIDLTQHTIFYRKDSNSPIYKKLYYFIVDVSKYYELPNIIPKNMLQLEEIDYAAFFSKSEAKELIFHRQLEILRYV